MRLLVVAGVAFLILALSDNLALCPSGPPHRESGSENQIGFLGLAGWQILQHVSEFIPRDLRFY